VKHKLPIITVALGAVALLAFGERQVLVQERVRRQKLQAKLATTMLATDPSATREDSTESTSAEAQAALRDLPRLRNEVRQLRDSVAELPRLRDERARLGKQLSDTASKPQIAEPTPEAGFLMSSAWSFAGFATPEATVQSFFSAMRDSNVVSVIACLPPEFSAGERSEERIRQTQSEFMRAAEGFRRVTGYRVIATDPVAEDRVTLKIQAAANGTTIDMRLRRIDGQWKMDFGR